MEPVLSPAPAPLLHSPMPMLHPEPTQSPLYSLPLPLSPAPGQLVIPPYPSHNGQLWFAPPQPPAYINSDPLYYQPPPLRPASANPNPNLNNSPPMIPARIRNSRSRAELLLPATAPTATADDHRSWSTSSMYITPFARNLTRTLRLSTTIRSRTLIAETTPLAKTDHRRRPICRANQTTKSEPRKTRRDGCAR